MLYVPWWSEIYPLRNAFVEMTEGVSRAPFLKSAPPKGETTHYILCVANAPSSSAVTDSLDFQVADAPLQIQFA